MEGVLNYVQCLISCFFNSEVKVIEKNVICNHKCMIICS